MKKYNYIYKTTNLINDKFYIGLHRTDNINDGYLGSGICLRNAIKKYSEVNFTKEILAFSDNQDNLDFLERYYIKKFNAIKNGYNLALGGVGKTKNNYKKTYLKIIRQNIKNLRQKTMYHYKVEDFEIINNKCYKPKEAYKIYVDKIYPLIVEKNKYNELKVKKMSYRSFGKITNKLNIQIIRNFSRKT